MIPARAGRVRVAARSAAERKKIISLAMPACAMVGYLIGKRNKLLVKRKAE